MTVVRWTNTCLALVLGAATTLAVAQAAPTPAHEGSKYLHACRDTYQEFAAETEKMLREDVLDVWFPRAIDNEHGGFYSVFSREWKP